MIRCVALSNVPSFGGWRGHNTTTVDVWDGQSGGCSGLPWAFAVHHWWHLEIGPPILLVPFEGFLQEGIVNAATSTEGAFQPLHVHSQSVSRLPWRVPHRRNTSPPAQHNCSEAFPHRPGSRAPVAPLLLVPHQIWFSLPVHLEVAFGFHNSLELWELLAT